MDSDEEAKVNNLLSSWGLEEPDIAIFIGE